MSVMANAKHFALLTTGIGYLSRVREIEPDKGLPFLVVTISALRGWDEEVRYTYMDCRVSGRVCHSYVANLAPYVEAGDKVLIRFRTHDMFAETFTYRQGPKEGQIGVSVKAKLIGIEWARVNGVAYAELEETA